MGILQSINHVSNYDIEIDSFCYKNCMFVPGVRKCAISLSSLNKVSSNIYGLILLWSIECDFMLCYFVNTEIKEMKYAKKIISNC